MVAATRKMNEFKDEILARIDEKFNSLKTDILKDLKDTVMQIGKALKNDLLRVSKVF